MKAQPGENQLGVAILAAGASRRMGRPKLLLPWRRTSVLGHVLDQWCTLGAAQIAVILPPAHPGLLAELDRLDFPVQARVFNPAPEEGMLSSIRCAAAWTGWRDDIDRFALVLGDLPLIRPDSLQALIAAAAANPQAMCQLALAGAPKHPIVFPRAAWRGLITTQAATLKIHLAACASPRVQIECGDPGVGLDLDEPADYDRACALDRTTAPTAWPHPCTPPL